MQREVRDELDGAAGAVWRQLLLQAIETGRRREQADVHPTGTKRPSFLHAAGGTVESRRRMDVHARARSGVRMPGCRRLKLRVRPRRDLVDQVGLLCAEQMWPQNPS